MEEQVFNELDKNLISFLSVFVTLRRHDECFISINHLSLVGVLRRQPSVWLNETTSSQNFLDFTQLKNCSSPKKNILTYRSPYQHLWPVSHPRMFYSHISPENSFVSYWQWNICWAAITSTLVRSREFRATPKQWRQLKFTLLGKKINNR